MSMSISDSMDQLLDRFDEAWNEPTPPRIEDYLAKADPDMQLALLIELVRIDLERRLAAGEKARLEEVYLPRFPELRGDTSVIVTLVKHEFDLRRRKEPELTPREFMERFPQCQTDLLAQLPTLDKLPLAERQQRTEDAPAGLDLRGYELMETLGKGGMGEVYRCVDPALGRDLAIKVMKAEYRGNAEAERRFLREARVTGELQHPGIVPIHNLGRLNDGRLHYTMRLVRGGTFADILNDKAGQPERLPYLLSIFEKICQAVAYAHSKRVIHRDLKPHNVMVGRFGEVQVMDWGLAKVMTAADSPTEVEEKTDATGTRIVTESVAPVGLSWTGSEMGTPAYMSPEQALGEWDAVDERADVFAIGSILCDILTGQPVYSGADGRKVHRRARRGDVAEALLRLQQCGADAALTALCRECLSPNRDDRPRDAAVVANRVAAHQAEVQERLRRAEVERASAQAKAREERKRRRWVIAFLLVLLTGILGTSLGLVRAERLRGLAQEKEREAQEEKAHALASQRQAMEALRATTDDVVEQLIGGKPVLGLAERAFLEKTLKRWQAFADAAGEDELARAIRAEGLFRVARLRSNLGQRDKAVVGYQEAIALYGKLADDYPGAPQHRKFLALTYAYLGAAFRDLGKQQERETAVRQALALTEKLAADFPDRPEYRFDEAISRQYLGWMLQNQSKYAEAESSYRRALALYDQLIAAWPDVAQYRQNKAVTLTKLGILLMHQRMFKEAEAAGRQAIALLEKLVDAFPAVRDYRASLAGGHTDLGVVFERQERIPEAEASYRASLAIWGKLAAEFPAVPDYRDQVGMLSSNLSTTLLRQGKQEGEKVLRQALPIAEKLVAEYPTVPEYRLNLGWIQNRLGSAIWSVSKEPEKALPWYDKAIATQEEALRRGGSIDRVQQALRTTLESRANALSTLQRHAEALKDYDKLVELTPVPERPYRRSIRAGIRVRAGQVAAAIEEAEELAKNADYRLLYDAACVYALASKPAKANPVSSELQAKYAERAIALLRQAVAKGFRDVNHMSNDDDLKSLRQRDDFQKLLRDMQK